MNSPNRLLEIEALGQSVWLDNLTRQLLDDGDLGRLIDRDGLSGVTSNPTIFERGIGHSDRYDDAIRELSRELDDPQEIFEQLAHRDVRDAADLLMPMFEQTGGVDGYVSFELPASLAHDADGSVAAALTHRGAIDRANVLIKVPGTEAGVAAFEQLTALGVNVNVTLLFAVSRYEEVAEAYLRGLEQRVTRGEPVDRSASVASFFVSRVDTKIDAELERLGRPELRGRAAVANAKLAYESFGRIFSGPRWERLAARGANVQRPLWGSTSTKSPDYPDTLYVDELIGPHTVNTMPDATLAAARDHASPARTVDRDVDGAHEAMRAVCEAGVDVERIVLDELVMEGVEAFADSYASLLSTLERKARALAPTA
ncbi:MAG TPA: transaldolase [Solirubrobacteraceae bacterium]